MGAILSQGISQKEQYTKLRSQEDDLEERLLRRRRPLRQPAKFCSSREAAPRFVLYDMEVFRAVEDHESVRAVLLRIPEWLPQRPTNGYIEYWYYFRREGQPLTPLRQLYPAARARLPWPLLRDASPEILQNFAHAVNRIAHYQLLSLQLRSMETATDTMPNRRQDWQNLGTKATGRTNRLRRNDESMNRNTSWRPISRLQRSVRGAFFKLRNRNRNHGTD